jgi:hypothetical protein
MSRFAPWWRRLLPGGFYYADELTASAKRLLLRSAIAVLAIAAGASAGGLVDGENWRDVLAGALLASGISMMVWAVSSYRSWRSETFEEIRRTAEVDLLHARLNQIAARVGAPLLNIDTDLEPALSIRTERLAHYSGLNEFRTQALGSSSHPTFWDLDALGQPHGGRAPDEPPRGDGQSTEK